MIPGSEGAARQSGEKIRQVGKQQPAAIAAVEETVDEGAAKFITPLPVVPAEVIGGVGDILPVGVHAAARQGRVGSDSGFAAHMTERQGGVIALRRGAAECAG